MHSGYLCVGMINFFVRCFQSVEIQKKHRILRQVPSEYLSFCFRGLTLEENFVLQVQSITVVM